MTRMDDTHSLSIIAHIIVEKTCTRSSIDMQSAGSETEVQVFLMEVRKDIRRRDVHMMSTL